MYRARNKPSFKYGNPIRWIVGASVKQLGANDVRVTNSMRSSKCTPHETSLPTGTETQYVGFLFVTSVKQLGAIIVLTLGIATWRVLIVNYRPDDTNVKPTRVVIQFQMRLQYIMGGYSNPDGIANTLGSFSVPNGIANKVGSHSNPNGIASILGTCSVPSVIANMLDTFSSFFLSPHT